MPMACFKRLTADVCRLFSGRFGTRCAWFIRPMSAARAAASQDLSACESKQTVVEVWRPRPSRDTARFTNPGKSRVPHSSELAGGVAESRIGGTGAIFGRDVCPARLAGPL